MFDQSTIVVLLQYASQALLALIVMLLLNKFYRNYQNKYFQYWSWSWLGLMLYMIGSATALTIVFSQSANHPLRTATSVITIIAGLFQAMWLLIGSYELSHQRELRKRTVIIVSILIVPLALALVLPYTNNPTAATNRLFLRVGVKSLISGFSFVVSAILIFRLRHSGIGIKFIIIAFLMYGLEQFNYFMSFLAPVLDLEYFLETPYYLGVFDFLLQSVMGIGMIISVLELERVHLKKANAELDTFLYRSSHDLRAPLTTILGIVDAIKSEKDPTKVDGFIGLIENRVHQADKVIKDIITLRKGQKVGLIIEEVNLKKMIESVFETLTSPATKKITLQINSDQDLITTDPEKLETALSNILSNAIKYHNPDQSEPTIKVAIEKSTQVGEVVVTILDNGTGIDEKHLPKVFDMFYRANKNSKGSGLGLYLTKDAIEQIEGKIKVSSEKGIGTRFTLWLKNLEGNLSIP